MNKDTTPSYVLAKNRYIVAERLGGPPTLQKGDEYVGTVYDSVRDMIVHCATTNKGHDFVMYTYTLDGDPLHRVQFTVSAEQNAYQDLMKLLGVLPPTFH